MNILKAVQEAHDDYNAWTGRVVHTSTTTSYDPQAKAWIKRTVEYIDLGRSDAVRAANEEELQPERFPDEPVAQKVVKARAQAKLNAIARRAAFESIVVALMREHGALSMKRLVYLTGRTHCFILPHITERIGTVYRRVEGGRGAAWGLMEEEE